MPDCIGAALHVGLVFAGGPAAFADLRQRIAISLDIKDEDFAYSQRDKCEPRVSPRLYPTLENC